MRTGAKSHQNIDICPNPIANKYHEGAVKRTLKI